jgi:hypothetical protein
MAKSKNAVAAALFLAFAASSTIRAQELNWDRGADIEAMTAGLSKKFPSVKATLVSDGGGDNPGIPSSSLAAPPLYELEQATSGDGGIYFFSVAGNHPVDSSGNNLAVFTYDFDEAAYEENQKLNYAMEHGVSSLDSWSGLEDSQIREAQSNYENWTFGSNVAVYVAPDLSMDHVDSISVWIDPGGRIHSLDTLRRQLKFRVWYGRHRLYEHSDLTMGRQNVFHMQAPAITEIMDRDTLDIPLMKLEWRYDEVYRSFLEHCGQASASGCSGSPWPNEFFKHWAEALDAARGALDNLANLLASVPFSKPISINASVAPLMSESSGNQYGGLSLSFPGFSRKELVGMLNGRSPQNDPISPWGATDRNQSSVEIWSRNLPNPQCDEEKTSCLIGLPPASDEPENQVVEFIDPSSLSQNLIESIQESRHAADNALQNAEALASP